MTNQSILIFSGYNQRAVIALCRWAFSNNVSFHIIANGKNDTIFLTNYKKNVSFVRKKESLNIKHIVQWCETLITNYSYDRILVIPSSEYFNRFLLDNRKEIENDKVIIPLVDYRLYKTISDKKAFVELCNKYSIKTPNEFKVIREDFPFVAKPIKYISRDNKQLTPHIISNKKELQNFKKKKSRGYFFQKFIRGKSIYLLAYKDKNNCTSFSQENLIQQSGGGSIILARESEFHLSEESKKYIHMLDNEEFTGIIMIEVRQEYDSGEYYMIEANPRIWGPLQFIVDNNKDILCTWLNSFGFEIKKNINKTAHLNNYYYWSGGIYDKSITYHNYSKQKFLKDYEEIKKSDVFSRQDTYNLYKKERCDKNDK